MRHRFQALLVGFLLLTAVLLLFRRAGNRSATGSSVSSLQQTVLTAASNAPAFIRSRVTGGVGALLSADPASGFPAVRGVLTNSPAANAGLRAGDLITAINGWSTSNQPLVRVVDAMHGLSRGEVTLAVQRPGSTNFTVALRRGSWNSLGVSVSNTVPPPMVVTNSVP